MPIGERHSKLEGRNRTLQRSLWAGGNAAVGRFLLGCSASGVIVQVQGSLSGRGAKLLKRSLTDARLVNVWLLLSVNTFVNLLDYGGGGVTEENGYPVRHRLVRHTLEGMHAQSVARI